MILFLIRTMRVGGAEKALVDIANRMVQDGFSVTVQTLFDTGYYKEMLDPKVNYRPGIRSRFLKVFDIVQKLYVALPARVLGKLLIGKGYSHIVAFTEGLPAKIVSGCTQKNVKKIAWVHTDLYNNYSSKYFLKTHEKYVECYRNFDEIICVSNDSKKGFIKRIGEHSGLSVQYNPMDKDIIIQKSLCEPEYKMSNNDVFRIAALGRLVDVKNFDMLIDAVLIVKKQVSIPFELCIIGDGVERKALEEKIKTNQLEDTVFLCGLQTNPYSIMRFCDMQVISSKAEGYPISLCEGHILGLPVVSTKCSGPVEIINDSKAGILTDHTAEALAKGISAMINDKDFYEKCKKNVNEWKDNYDSDEVYRQIESRFIQG